MGRLKFAAALACAAIATPSNAQEPGSRPDVPPVVSEPEVPLGRLGDAVVPARYRLDLAVDPARERFAGHVEIDVALARPSRSIDLHAYDLAIRSASARIGARNYPAEWEVVDPSGVLRLRFAEELPAGELTLLFDYDAPFNDGPAGMFRVNVGGDWYSWTQFQSIDARAAFPSFDQPSFKTPFEVTLRTPVGQMAVSNAPRVSTETVDGWDIHRFAPTRPLPTYLVAMMVGPFVAVEGTAPPTPQRADPLPLRIVSTRPNAGRLDFALENSKEIVVLLESYFDDAFPYPKLDQITSPIMPGAMENAGADLYKTSLLVMDEDAPIAQQRSFGKVVSHELAHQWFGDLVTPAWWDDIWLNESFANWMGFHIGHQWRPALNLGSGALADGFEAMQTDALVAGRPVRAPVATSAQIDEAFDSITYGKGGHVIAMIADFMGPERFRDGVRRYMRTHRDGNATSMDFFAALAEAAEDPRIVPALRSFVGQQGVPLVTIERAADGFTATQSRYAPLGVEAPETRWGIPLCVRQGERRMCQLLDERSGTFPLAGRGAVMPNAGGTGYYRFELPEKDWEALIARAGDLPGGEAQALADSLAASVLAGRSDVRALARLARNLVHHPDTYAADAASDALNDLSRSGLLDGEGRRGWRKFRGRLYAPLLREYGFDPGAGAYVREDPERSQRRAQIVERLMGSTRDNDVRATLMKSAEAYLEGDTRALDPVWFDKAFAAHIYRRGESGARDLVAAALASEDPLFRPAALGSAAGSGNEGIARWLLEELDDPRLRESERRSMLRAVVLNSSTREYGYGWMLQNIDSLLEGGGIFDARRIPQMLTRYCSVEDSQRIARDFGPHLAGTAGALELGRTVEIVRNCGMLKDALGDRISDAFADFG
ncbi:aminopeptidase [Novosphingobium marinum]|uniref:Aminopeptidase n=1 Tax=Novosphingobium marinum TaxID=1514948 RepID=A0A7Z0BUW3_9SPHN|nr:M1 family metallopeptidase [Novosphingobium marinum]NYH94730.1 hypothetical protein [Novosphingobium marinum]GGC37773.1 aminopeptidase [Novosphingobium marinum]